MVTAFRKSSSPIADFNMYCNTSKQSCFCLAVSSFDTNFTDTLQKWYPCSKCNVPNLCYQMVICPTWLTTYTLGQCSHHFCLRIYQILNEVLFTNYILCSLICGMPKLLSPKMTESSKWISLSIAKLTWNTAA